MSSAKSRICFALAAALALVLAGCKREANTQTRTATTPDASAQVIGVTPANPSAQEPPGVTPVAPNTETVSKQADSTQRPLEGDNHSYSSVAPNTAQKGDQPGTDARTTK
jgi:hypothetical protein